MSGIKIVLCVFKEKQVVVCGILGLVLLYPLKVIILGLQYLYGPGPLQT